MSDDAQVLFPGKEVTLSSGEAIKVEPFTFIECMTSAAKYARSFAGSLKTGSVLDIVADGGEDVLKLVQLAVKKPPDWWAKLMPDDGLALTSAVLSVNRDFFTQRLEAPLKSLVAAIGEQSLPVSSAAVTEEVTSTATP
jgi:hypothetical protein